MIPASIARRSDAISIARVICIVGVVYVHAWTGRGGADLDALRTTGQEVLRWVLMEIFGRSAVPLLGFISGWLVSGSRRTRDWRDHVGRKARTILLPMALWNILAILLVSGASRFGTLAAPQPHSLIWLAQELFILTRNPHINVQMPFLRDLFLCMLAAPLLVRAPGWLLWLVVLAAGSAHIGGYGPPILMRASILFFFALGMLAQRGAVERRVAAWPMMAAALPFALLTLAQLIATLRPDIMLAPVVAASLDLALRVSAALFFWRLAWALAGTNARETLLRLEPYVFFLFCAHLILIWLFGPVLGLAFGRLGEPLYPLYLLIQPALVLVAVIGIARLLTRIAPRTAGILSGGRLKPA
ncbi:MAG: acyltransferase [Sphingobium sp.]